ncbi:MAG: alpha/beta hydrolase [Halioglobus sp.]|nr:alpha/beta hydrolase [Halioglobus sp.]
MHPYFQAIVAAYAAAGRPFFHQVTPAVARNMMRAAQSSAPQPLDLPVLASVTDEQVDGPHGNIGIRRYLPNGNVVGTCVFCHAGGWVIGDLDTADNLCRRLAGRAGVEVISVDYRLAPEYAFPVPLDDVHAVLRWADTLRRPLVVAGESAGANLVAACAIRVRDEGGPHIVGQFLAYPVTDHDFETESYRCIGPKNWLLSRADMQWFWDHYCPPSVGRSNPQVSPLHLATAAGLPQAFVLVAELDPLRDEGLAYAALLKAHGVPVIVREGRGMLHGYLNAAGAIPEVAVAVAEAADWMRACIVNGSGDSRL